MYITVIKGGNILYIKTTDELVGLLYEAYLPYGCCIFLSNENEYNEGLKDDLSFDVTDIRTIEEVLE